MGNNLLRVAGQTALIGVGQMSFLDAQSPRRMPPSARRTAQPCRWHRPRRSGSQLARHRQSARTDAGADATRWSAMGRFLGEVPAGPGTRLSLGRASDTGRCLRPRLALGLHLCGKCLQQWPEPVLIRECNGLAYSKPAGLALGDFWPGSELSLHRERIDGDFARDSTPILIKQLVIGVATKGDAADPSLHAGLLEGFPSRRLCRLQPPYRPALRNDPAMPGARGEQQYLDLAGIVEAIWQRAILNPNSAAVRPALCDGSTPRGHTVNGDLPTRDQGLGSTRRLGSRSPCRSSTG